jgi:mannose-P-dolichol utilization defect 1
MDSIRSALQPVTHNLPGPIRDLGVSILGDACYKTLILDIDHTATECIKLAISKGLGIGIIAGSATVKIPQLLKIISSRSASGVSFLSYLMESSAFLIGLAYSYRQGFPFSTYGENALILAQNVVISVLVLHYSGKTNAAAVFAAGLAATVFALFNPQLVDAKIMSYLQIAASVLGVGSKVPQILAIYQEGGTGQLSAFAVCFLPS